MVHRVTEESDTTERRARTHKRVGHDRATHMRSGGLWGRIKAFGFDPGS